jgi:cysteine synthase
MPLTPSRVGNTPLVELPRLSPKPGIRIFAKLEGDNPSGSVKDRIAEAILDDAEARGALKPGSTLIEASTGNTAIALASAARRRGYELKVVVPEGVVPSIGDVLDLFGVEMIRVSPKAGMKGAIETAVRLAAENGWYATRQFDNRVNVQTHYETTGAELVAQLDRIDVFVAGVGTGGTMMGVGRRLRERWPEVKLVAVEPRMGEYLQGLRCMDDAFHPPLVDLSVLDGRFLVRSADALEAMRRIVREEGVLAGVSAGATLHAALRYAERLERANIVVMFSDGAWKYLPARPWQAALERSACLDEVHWW